MVGKRKVNISTLREASGDRTAKAFKAAVAAAEVVNVSKPLKAKVISLMDTVAKSLNAFTGSPRSAALS